MRFAVLALLAVDGVLGATLVSLLLLTRISGVPLPVSAIVGAALAGTVNMVLVWAASLWTESLRVAALPLWTWLATVLAFTFGGPGGDIGFGGAGFGAYAPLVLLIGGAGPAAWLLARLSTETWEGSDGPNR